MDAISKSGVCVCVYFKRLLIQKRAEMATCLSSRAQLCAPARYKPSSFFVRCTNVKQIYIVENMKSQMFAARHVQASPSGA